MNRIINTLALATAGLVLLCGCSADPATDEAAPGGNDGKTVPVSFAAELYEGENETYIEASVENSSSILYDKEIRNKPRTRRTKRNV